MSGAVHVKGTPSTRPVQQEEDAQGCSQVGQTGIVKIHTTVEEISVKLDKRKPHCFVEVFTQAGLETGLRLSLERFSTRRLREFSS